MFRVLLSPVLALVTSLALGALVMLLFGDDPILAYQGLFQGAFGSGKQGSAVQPHLSGQSGEHGRVGNVRIVAPVCLQDGAAQNTGAGPGRDGTQLNLLQSILYGHREGG